MTPPELDLENPRIWLDPADVSAVQSTGADFARAFAGAPPEAFMLALGEMEELILSVLRRTGYDSRMARLAAIEFSAAAVIEWERIEPAFNSNIWGNA